MKASYNPNADSIATNREVLRQRRDYSERLLEAFEELSSIAQAEEAETRSVDSLAESGFYLSARSSFHSELAEAMMKLDSAVVSPTDSEIKSDRIEDVEEKLISF